MFNFNKEKISLTPDEKCIVFRSLTEYSNQLQALMSNHPKIASNEQHNLQYVCLESYFHLVEHIKKKFE